MKKFILFILLLISVNVSAQNFEWVKTFGGYDDDLGYKCAVDADGNFLFTGEFKDTVDFGDVILQTYGYKDMFVIKTDKNGTVLWAEKAGGDMDNKTIGRAVASDNENNVYVGGTFSDTLYIDTEVYYGNTDGKSDCFLAKYSSSGDFLWVKIFSGPERDVIEDVNVSGNQIVITGSYSATFDILGNTLESDDPDVGSNWNPFVASFNLSGEVNWINKIDCRSGTCRAFDIDPSGNINLLLEAKGSPVMKTVNTSYQYTLKQSTNISLDNYLVQVNSADGTGNWGNRIGSVDMDMGYAVTTDKNNNVYCGGIFKSELKLESQDGNYQKVNATGKYDYFVCKYSPEGNLLWVDAQGGVETEGARDMVVNSNGSLYVVAYFLDPATQFHGEEFTCTDGNESLFIKYNADGEYQWAKQTNTSAFSGYLYALDVNQDDSIIMIGHFRGDGTFFDEQVYTNVNDKKNIWFSCFSDTDETTGFEADFILQDKVIFYPNPVKDELHININKDINIESISMYNILGELVQNYDQDAHRINVRQLKSGIYFIQITTNSEQITEQIIVNH